MQNSVTLYWYDKELRAWVTSDGNSLHYRRYCERHGYEPEDEGVITDYIAEYIGC